MLRREARRHLGARQARRHQDQRERAQRACLTVMRAPSSPFSR
jgi:hypothetical protein